MKEYKTMYVVDSKLQMFEIAVTGETKYGCFKYYQKQGDKILKKKGVRYLDKASYLYAIFEDINRASAYIKSTKIQNLKDEIRSNNIALSCLNNESTKYIEKIKCLENKLKELEEK